MKQDFVAMATYIIINLVTMFMVQKLGLLACKNLPSHTGYILTMYIYMAT